VAGNTLVSALADSSIPRLNRYFINGDKGKFKHLLIQLLSIAFIFGVIALTFSIFFSKEILTILYNNQYISYSHIFIMLMFAGLLNYIAWFLESAMSSARSFLVQSIIGVTCLVITYCCCLLFIPQNGIVGAVYVTLIYSITLLLFRFIVVYKLVERI
jgi:O-antigen/teichoic acid export membrane protein